MQTKFNFWDEVECKVTGFRGTVTAKVEFINGCFRYAVQPKVDKEGKHQDAIYFDEPQLQLVKQNPVQNANRAVGGPVDNPPRMPTPN